MAFTTFTYRLLKSNILQLGKSYSTLIGRYAIIDSSNDSSSKSKNTLAILIGRVNDHVSQSTTGRTSQRDVFVKLNNELTPYIEGTLDEVKNCSLTLLGALIHRHYRLLVEDTTWNPIKFFNYNLVNVVDCRLAKAIQAALQLDKKKLDEYTVVVSLQVFQKHMLKEIEDYLPGDKTKTIKQARYLFYPHFAREDKDENKGDDFKSHLSDMINEHQKCGASVIKQFQAISFMQSLVSQLEKDNEPVEQEMSDWITILSKTHKDFSSLTQEIMVSHLNDYFQLKQEKSAIKERILELINMGYETRIFEGIKDYSLFIEKMNVSHTDESRCILCGGYALLLQRGKLEKDLLTLIFKSLGLKAVLSTLDQFDCMEFLKSYVEREPSPVLNCDFFGGSDNMVTQVTQLWVSLAQEIQEIKESKDTVALAH